MHFLFVMLLAAFCVAMFVVSRPTKIGILIIAGLCISEYRLPTSIGVCMVILPLCFFIAEYTTLKKVFKWHSINRSIIFWIILLGICYVIFTIIISPHLHSKTVISYIIKALVGRYLLPLVAFVCIKNELDMLKAYKFAFVGVVVMTFFGVINLIFHHSIYVDWLFEGRTLADYLEGAGSMYSESERFRVQATFHNPFDYGYTCIIFLLFFWYGYLTKKVPRKQFVIVVACALFGILTCHCRTVYFCALLTLFLFYSVSQRKNVNYLLICISVLLIGLLSILLVPYLHEKFSMVLSLFDDSSDVRGSSLEIRLIQISSVFFYIKDHLLFGRGVYYFYYDLGFGEGGRAAGVSAGLYGLEGTYLQSLLETGIIGTLFYFSIIIIILVWAYKKKIHNMKSAAVLFSFITLFFIFGIMTGELNSQYFTFLLCGIPIKEIYTKKIEYR